VGVALLSHRPIATKAEARAKRAEEKLKNTVPQKLADRMNARFQELLSMGYNEARAADKTQQEFMKLAREIRREHAP
jgi:hypothetical protein